MNHSDIAKQINELRENIVLIYAFNTTGKTRLSVAYKDETKEAESKQHTGVYYNAFSEDLFLWDNDTENNEENIKLQVKYSSLNKFHASLNEVDIRNKLTPYKIKYDFSFNSHDDIEKGIESITFFLDDGEDKTVIKISRGEERIFVWCFFLALFEVDGLADQQSNHFFIDDPVSSLDDHNVFMTALTLLNLIEDYSDERKIIITTHHIGLFSILANWLTRGEKADKYKRIVKLFILNKGQDNNLSLDNPRNNVFLYHLHLLQVLFKAKEEETLSAYHFVLLRQVLENIASFLGVGRFAFVLEQIGIDDPSDVANIVNILSHKNMFTYETDINVPDNRELIENILEKIQAKYSFVLHTD